MSAKGMTTMEVAKINRQRLYQFIYQAGQTCKLDMVDGLNMGLSTVAQNLKTMEGEGFIRRNGFFQSTGGRKAHCYEIVPTARIALGVGILKEMVHLVSVDLYGHVIHQKTHLIPYASDSQYMASIGAYISDFVHRNHHQPDCILGVSIAIQGLVSPDGQQVHYGAILGNESMQLSDFQAHIPYPCHLVHDSKSATFLELWNHPQVTDGVVLLLNRNLGGGIIVNREVHHGTHMRSGLIEHLCIHPEGPLCYCGKRGCLETYCSAEHLKSRAGTSLDDFFQQLRQGDAKSQGIWEEYLGYLAHTIGNLSVIVDGHFIISGYLSSYFTQEDTHHLRTRVNQYAPFPLDEDMLLISNSGDYAPSIGAALYYVDAFLKS